MPHSVRNCLMIFLFKSRSSLSCPDPSEGAVQLDADLPEGCIPVPRQALDLAYLGDAVVHDTKALVCHGIVDSRRGVLARSDPKFTASIAASLENGVETHIRVVDNVGSAVRLCGRKFQLPNCQPLTVFESVIAPPCCLPDAVLRVSWLFFVHEETVEKAGWPIGHAMFALLVSAAENNGSVSTLRGRVRLNGQLVQVDPHNPLGHGPFGRLQGSFDSSGIDKAAAALTAGTQPAVDVASAGCTAAAETGSAAGVHLKSKGRCFGPGRCGDGFRLRRVGATSGYWSGI